MIMKEMDFVNTFPRTEEKRFVEPSNTTPSTTSKRPSQTRSAPTVKCDARSISVRLGKK